MRSKWLAPTSLLLLSGLVAYAKVGFISPFPSTVEGLSIPNAHLVGKSQGEVYRGMSPDGKARELHDLGITDVLVFKDDFKNEVKDEVAELVAGGFEASQVHNIPFYWNKVDSFQADCVQIIDGLKLLQAAYSTPGKKIYFHCTVGEDRTGLLAGLFRMANEPVSARKAFDEEMCLNGYEAGDPTKPDNVNQVIFENLTPIYLKMAMLIESGKLKGSSLASLDSASVCAAEPVLAAYKPEDFRCKNSPRYVPLKK
jgi:hypothetical protein